MKVKNCPQCGSLFIDVGFRVCERCLKYENEQFEIVKEYLQKNAGVTVEQISEATGVSRQLILQFIKAGRLSGSITKLAGPGSGANDAINRFWKAGFVPNASRNLLKSSELPRKRMITTKSPQKCGS